MNSAEKIKRKIKEVDKPPGNQKEDEFYFDENSHIGPKDKAQPPSQDKIINEEHPETSDVPIKRKHKKPLYLRIQENFNKKLIREEEIKLKKFKEFVKDRKKHNPSSDELRLRIANAEKERKEAQARRREKERDKIANRLQQAQSNRMNGADKLRSIVQENRKNSDISQKKSGNLKAQSTNMARLAKEKKNKKEVLPPVKKSKKYAQVKAKIITINPKVPAVKRKIEKKPKENVNPRWNGNYSRSPYKKDATPDKKNEKSSFLTGIPSDDDEVPRDRSEYYEYQPMTPEDVISMKYFNEFNDDDEDASGITLPVPQNAPPLLANKSVNSLDYQYNLLHQKSSNSPKKKKKTISESKSAGILPPIYQGPGWVSDILKPGNYVVDKGVRKPVPGRLEKELSELYESGFSMMMGESK